MQLLLEPCLTMSVPNSPARFRSQVDHYVMSHSGAVYTDHHQVVPDVHLTKAEYFNDMLWGSPPNDKYLFWKNITTLHLHVIIP